MTNPSRRAVLLLLLCLPRQAGTAFELQALEDGVPVVRQLASGETQSYRFALAADQFVSLRVEQRGVDVAVTLLGPDGSKRTDSNTAKGTEGAESVSIIADTPGDYQIDIRAAEKNTPPGRYEITLVARRAPSADERTLEEARRLFDQSRALRDRGKYDEALPPVERVIALREQVRGADDISVASALHLLAVIYDDKNEYAKAEAPNLRALAIREKTLGPDHPDVARSLFNLAWLAKVKQDYAQAEALYKRALSIQEKALGPDHTEVATTLNDLAILYNQQGRYDDSIQVVTRVLAIRERAQGLESDGVAKALNNLARVYEVKGDYEKSGALLQRAVAIWEKALGPDHPDVANGLDGLAKSYSLVGDYAAAEPLFLRALAIRERALGPDHPEVGTTLNNLATLYRQKGDYARAERLFQRDLVITEKRLGPMHAFVGPTLTNLAAVAQARGEFDKAAQLSQRALTIYEASVGPNHVNVGLTLNRLAQVYALDPTKTPAEVEAAYRRALATFEKAVGPDYPVVASSLSGLASIAAGRGDRAEAERLLERALAVQEKSLGPDHPDVASSLETLASLRQKDGDIRPALALLSRADDIRERHLAHNLPLGSERQKLGYLKLFGQDTDRALALNARFAPADAQAVRLAFTTLLRRKGRALDATSDNIAILRLNASPQDQALFDRLAASRSKLAAVTLRGPAGAAAGYQSLLDRLQDDVDQLEADIGARSAAFRAQSRPITLDTVRSTLPEDGVLIEFAAYHPDDERAAGDARSHYAAYVLAARGEPQWVDLGDAAGIDRAVDAWRAALSDPRRSDARALGRALDARLMQPVRARLGAAAHLLISPDGPLNLIPFAALIDEQNRPLIERFRITYLTSGRDLLRLEVPRESRSPATIVAAPAFGDPALVSTGRGSSKVDYSQVFFGPLPGVTEEVRALKEMLPQATVLTGDQATEAALRRVSAPRILHVATHGFFLRDGDVPRDLDASSPGGTRIGKWAAWAENPLLRSGLAMAGANQGRSGEDDGVLTALEAAGLDLWGTKLVVLSACDTGVGDVKRGDGVYGLRRALVLAGAESQLMSLWPVSDRSTRDLMIGYYRQLTQGEGRGEALRQVQLRMLRDGRHEHPYYWGSFIQSGEWANLDGRR